MAIFKFKTELIFSTRVIMLVESTTSAEAAHIKQDLIYHVDRETGSLSLDTSRIENMSPITHPVEPVSSVEETLTSPEMETPAAKPQSAIDEETGEINWDCPCLQAAIAPPCGEAFKAAFSCFVASKTEPKGSDCLGFFSTMQDCYRAHPEIYMKGDEIADDSSEPKNNVDADAAEQGILIDVASN